MLARLLASRTPRRCRVSLEPALLGLGLCALPACSTEDVDCVVACPAEAKIIDFQTGSVQGSLFAEGGLNQVLEDGTWHITGTGAGASFGVHFGCIKQAGVFDGLLVEMTNNQAAVRLNWELESTSNRAASDDACANPGTCPGDCTPATNSINVSPTFGVPRLWTSFMGGRPGDTPLPNELLGMRFRLPDTAGNVDLVIDNLEFVLTTETE